MLNTCKFLIHLIDFRLNELSDFCGLRQALVVGKANVVRLRVLLHVVMVHHDDGREIRQAVAHNDGIRDVG